jgi:hypothetical protein
MSNLAKVSIVMLVGVLFAIFFGCMSDGTRDDIEYEDAGVDSGSDTDTDTDTDTDADAGPDAG